MYRYGEEKPRSQTVLLAFEEAWYAILLSLPAQTAKGADQPEVQQASREKGGWKKTV
jgi:hypothetical protein